MCKHTQAKFQHVSTYVNVRELTGKQFHNLNKNQQ
jgi:hypothetical protein